MLFLDHKGTTYTYAMTSSKTLSKMFLDHKGTTYTSQLNTPIFCIFWFLDHKGTTYTKHYIKMFIIFACVSRP